MGRRPVKVKVHRLGSRFFGALGLRSKVDVVAQQVLDHGAGIFRAVKDNDLPLALAQIDSDDGQCLLLRDSAGAAPVHLAFLLGHHELGKQLVLLRRELASLTYTTLESTGELSPYEGENILHIAIVQRAKRLCKWLVTHVPELINAETVGKFFRPGKTCYFGGTPLLFALASNQIDVALDILEAAEQLKKLPRPPHKQRALRMKTQAALFEQLNRTRGAVAKVLAMDQDDHDEGDEQDMETSIFMTDTFGNNALHLAVLHDLPQVFDFSVQIAMHSLADPHFSVATAPMDTITPLDASASEKAEDHRARERVASFSSSPLKLVDFLAKADDATHHKLLHGFVMQRNGDELTPLSLAAAIGNARMFEHILAQLTSLAWSYGPITALNIPLLDLEEPVPRESVTRNPSALQRILSRVLPSALAPQGQQGYTTAIQCLCSLDKLSSTIPTAALPQVLEHRLEMLQLVHVQQLLAKKWKYVGKRRFLTRLAFYSLFLLAFNASMLFATTAYENPATPTSHRVILALCECQSFGYAVVRFLNEMNQLLRHWKAYVTEAGAGRLDNVCTLGTCVFIFASGFARAANSPELTDAFTAIALVLAWFYLFFFLLGFRTTGPFVIMILAMIRHDIVRFIFVYVAVMAGFSQAVYVVADGRVGISTLLHRVRKLVIAGFTGEVNYDDNYTSGRMNALTQVLMLGYIILVMILLINLLIAMMGNTYTEILAKSEQRWVAERANIMATIENQDSAEQNHEARRRYAIPMATRGDGREEMFLQLETNNMDTWKKQQDDEPAD